MPTKVTNRQPKTKREEIRDEDNAQLEIARLLLEFALEQVEAQKIEEKPDLKMDH
jgi:hypothetical protein